MKVKRNAISDREKAAFLIGMIAAFRATKWPKHFNKDDRAQWLQREVWAKQMLEGGCYNPMHVWKVRELADEELGQ